MEATAQTIRVSKQAQAIAKWLRFERPSNAPVNAGDIEKGTGIKLTPSLLQEGERTGMFRYHLCMKSFC